MKKRRLTAALLCAVLAASTVLSGCGGKKTTEGGSTAQAGKEAGKNENGRTETMENQSYIRNCIRGRSRL